MEISQYLKIKLTSLHPSVPLTFNVFVFINNHYTLYLKAGDKIDAGKIQALMNRTQGDFFYVHLSEWKAYKTFIHDIIKSSAVGPLEKAHILRDSSLALVEELFEHPDVNVALNNSKPIIQDFITFMQNEPEAMGHLIGLSGHDFYTYNHSLDVSIYALGLGQILGMKDKDLEELGIAALFHDIGKRNVSLDILCKKGALNQDEWTIMQQHTHFGLVILNQNPDISDAIKATCFEHHESFIGNGYPQQLAGQDIHPFARIVAICDTYDAMTTQRSYNIPLKPFDALRMMKDQLANKFDPNMLKAMYSVLFQMKSNAS
jgi:HD-GYP domain-containing protein (c-di-GMP phosphodiesterase class II)